ncbi:response regulator transcription factor [Azonexus hydrophilus]|uniref:response regulator transcription factor n=1 Tax=Azonexus hydrophilus TaxID=418702 RepID=UPI0006851E0A|nr:response regulator transcription factor [Azonexus hydrophilus]
MLALAHARITIMANIILLEDESVLRAELADFLGEQGHCVDTAGSIGEFEQKFCPERQLIAIVDLGLPDGEGLDLITRLREDGDRIGIIVATARSGGRNKAKGLIQGADHYLSKPFELDELAATITALARRLEDGAIRPRWLLDTLRCQLTPPGKAAIDLTSQSYIVFRTIVSGAGKPVSRRKIVEALGENYLHYDQRRLDTQMYQLRKLVLDACGMDLPVATARGRGYQITEAVDLRG